jgi:hypothetical protein
MGVHASICILIFYLALDFKAIELSLELLYFTTIQQSI